MASIDIRSSAGQTDMDVEDLDFNFRGHDGEDADRCGDISNVTPVHSPLFLQLSVSLKKKINEDKEDQKERIISTTNIKTLPTCFYELCSNFFQNQDATQGTSNFDETLEEIEIMEHLGDQYLATLDLVCISLPQNLLNFPSHCKEALKEPLLPVANIFPQRNSDLTNKFETESNSETLAAVSEWRDSFSDHQKTLTSFNSLVDASNERTLDNSEKLPEIQQEIITSLKSDIEWMLEDEIAFAMIRSINGNPGNIQEEILATVARHVEKSEKQSGCVYQNIPLHFVFGPEKSYEMFCESVSSGEISPQGFKLHKIGENGFHLLHVVSNEKNGEPNVNYTQKDKNMPMLDPKLLENKFMKPLASSDSQDDGRLQKDNIAISSGGQNTRFNLSPVKEVQSQLSSTKPEVTSKDIDEANNSCTSMDIIETVNTSSTDQDAKNDFKSDISENDDDINPKPLRDNHPTLKLANHNVALLSSRVGNRNSFNKDANFWLILRLDNQSARIYFQYREGQFDAVLPWRQAQQAIVSNIKLLFKTINQKLLLKDLFENRVCNRLLESDEEVWQIDAGTRNINILGSDDPNKADPDEGYQATILEESLNVRFRPGTFKCPKVWEAEFTIHPRLLQTPQGIQMTTPQGTTGSRAFHAFKSSLGPFLVNNRSNLFVYQDTSQSRNIYYMKVLEIINKQPLTANTGSPTKIRQSPSSTSLKILSNTEKSPRKAITDKDLKVSIATNNQDSLVVQPNEEDKIVMQIYGLKEPGNDITNDFYIMLKNKLNDKTIEVLSAMLQRSNKMTPQDVYFLQPLRTKCTFSFLVRLSPLIKEHHSAFVYYVRQNLLQGGSIVEPKYTNPEVCLQDYENMNFIPKETDMPISSSWTSSAIFLHNGGRGQKELACIAISHLINKQLHDHEHNVEVTAPEEYHEWKEMIDIRLIESVEEQFANLKDDEFLEGSVVRFHIWHRARSGTNSAYSELRQDLVKNIKQSLWDLVTEKVFLARPVHILEDSLAEDQLAQSITINTPDAELGLNSKVVLSNPYSQYASNWFEAGLSLRVASMMDHKIKFRIGGNRENTHQRGGLCWLKELQHQIEISVPDLKVNCFMSNDDDLCDQAYRSCSRFFTPISSTIENAESKSLSTSYIMIGQNRKHSDACANSSNKEINIKDLVPKQLSSYQNFQPYFKISDAKPHQEDSLEETKVDVEENPTIIASSKRRIKGSIMSLFSPTSSHCSSPLVTPGTPTNPIFPTSNAPDRSCSMLKDAVSIASTAGADTNFGVVDFIPRQHLVMVMVKRCTASIYMYNLSKECIERVIKSTNSLCSWTEARSSLAASIMAQKAGLFHHQRFFDSDISKSKARKITPQTTRKKSRATSDVARGRKTSAATQSTNTLSAASGASQSSATSNPYIEDVYIENLVKYISHSKPPVAGVPSKTPLTPTYGGKNTLGISIRSADKVYPEVYRDTRPKKLISSACSAKSYDQILVQGSQLLEMRANDKKHIMHTLCQVWSTHDSESQKSSTDSKLWTNEVLEHFQDIGLLHYIEFLPLLFHHKWRHVATATKGTLQDIFATETREQPESIIKDAVKSATQSLNIDSLALHDNFYQNIKQEIPRKIDNIPETNAVNRSSSVSFNKTRLNVEASNNHELIIRSFIRALSLYIQQQLHFYPVRLCENPSKDSTQEQAAKHPSSPTISNAGTRGRSLSGGYKHNTTSRNSLHRNTEDQAGEKLGECYLYKPLPEGILLLKINVCPPYTIFGIYAIDAIQCQQHGLNNIRSKNNTPTQTLISHAMLDLSLIKDTNKNDSKPRNKYQDELLKYCGEIKHQISLHAFNYDYHLKLIHAHLAGAQGGIKTLSKHQLNLPLLRKGFHLVNFLNSFSCKEGYYFLKPNNAISLIGCKFLAVIDESNGPSPISKVEGSQEHFVTLSNGGCHMAYNYILAHELSFKFKLLTMESVLSDAKINDQTESIISQYNLDSAQKYALTRQVLYQLEWRDFTNNDKVVKTKDLSVTLIVTTSNEAVHKSSEESGIIYLKYILIVTPKVNITQHHTLTSTDINEQQLTVVLRHLSNKGIGKLSNCGIASSPSFQDNKS